MNAYDFPTLLIQVKIMRHPETGSARIIMRREKTMRVGERKSYFFLLFHRCVPTIQFCHGWTFAQTVAHRRWMLSYCSSWLFLQCHRLFFSFFFLNVLWQGLGVENASRLCWCSLWGGQTKAGGEQKVQTTWVFFQLIIWNCLFISCKL